MQFGDGEACQWHIGATGQLARQSFNVDDDAGGKAGRAPASRLFLKAGHSLFEETVAPFANDLAWRIEARGDEIVARILQPPAARSSRGYVSIR